MSIIEDMMKVELHCHLDGSMNPELIRELSGNKNLSIEDLQVTKECKSLTEYLQKFDLPLSCLQNAQGLEKAAYHFVEDVAKENVRYVEVRFAPMLSVNSQMDCRTVIESVIKGLEKAGREYSVYASVIVCAMRHHSEEQNMQMLKTAREFLGHGVCALDLAGDESMFPTKMFRELFRKASDWDMPFTIHSGECGSLENVKEAIALGAKRLGHGIALEQSYEIQELCRKKRIGIEMCPTSNLQTKAIKDFSHYPLSSFMKNGLLVSVNTDNRTVSGTTMTKELTLVKDILNESEENIRKCIENAIETSFADDQIKHELWKKNKG